MSRTLIKKALEKHLAANVVSLPIDFENQNFQPPQTAYLEATLLYAQPFDAGYKDSNFIQRGYMQVTLHFPTNQGSGPADDFAEIVAGYFKRGTSLVEQDQVVNIELTPEITGGQVEVDRFVKRVKIRFFAEVRQPA